MTSYGYQSRSKAEKREKLDGANYVTFDVRWLRNSTLEPQPPASLHFLSMMGRRYPRHVFGLTLSNSYLESRPEYQEGRYTAMYFAMKEAETVWPRVEITFVETKFGTRPCIGFSSNDSVNTMSMPSPKELIKIQRAMNLRKTANWYEEST